MRQLLRRGLGLKLNKKNGGSHAVVAVRSGEQWIVFDNRSYALVESSEFLKGYAPVAILPQLLQRELRTAEHKTH